MANKDFVVKNGLTVASGGVTIGSTERISSAGLISGVTTTQSSGTNSMALASTAFVQQEISSLIDSAPSNLNTLNELAAAMNDNASFFSTVLPLSGGTMTGDLIISDGTRSLTYDVSAGELNHAGQTFYINKTNGVDVSICNDDLYVDASTSRIGIGTTSPAAQLDVTSASSPTLQLKDTTNNTTFKAYAQDSNAHVATTSNHPLIFDVNNTEAFRIDTSGRLLIGTTSTTPAFSTGNGHAFHVSDMSHISRDDGTALAINRGGGHGTVLNLRSGGNSVGNFATSSTGIYVDTKFGIGASPTSLFQLTSATEDGTSLFSIYNANTNPDSEQFFIAMNGSSVEMGNARSNALDFFTSDTRRMRITSGGYVGVGTTSPQGELHLVGATGAPVRLYLSDVDDGTGAADSLLITKSGATAYIYNRDDGDLRLGTNDDNDMLTIDTTGKIGLGTNSPDTHVHISTSDRNIIKFHSSYGTARTYYFRNDSGVLNIGGGTPQDSNDLLNISPGNLRVGIGEKVPFSKLHVEDTSWSSGSPYGTVAYIEGGTVHDNNWGHLVVTNNSTTVGEGGKISLGANGGNPIAGIKAKYQGATYGDLVVSTRPSGGTSTERLTFTHSGHIHTATSGVSFNINKGITQYNSNHNDKSSGLYTRAGYYGSELSNNFSGIYRTPTYYTTSSSGSDIHFMNLFSSSHWGQYPYAEVTLCTTYFYPVYARFDIRMYGSGVKVYPHHNNSNHYNIHDGGGDMPQIKISGNSNSTTIDYDDNQFSSSSYADDTGAVHSGQPIYRTSVSFNTGRDYFYTFAIIKIFDSYAANRVITSGSTDAQAISYLSQKGGGFHFKNISESEAKHGGYNPAWVA